MRVMSKKMVWGDPRVCVSQRLGEKVREEAGRGAEQRGTRHALQAGETSSRLRNHREEGVWVGREK